jgi:hypothetical protein
MPFVGIAVNGVATVINAVWATMLLKRGRLWRSRTSQPVQATSPSPTSTPAEVTTSAMTWRPSAISRAGAQGPRHAVRRHRGERGRHGHQRRLGHDAAPVHRDADERHVEGLGRLHGGVGVLQDQHRRHDDERINVVAAATAFLALRWAAQPADSEHPYGHHKAEYVDDRGDPVHRDADERHVEGLGRLHGGVGVLQDQFLALRWAAQPADSEHPYGHHKAEYFSAVIEGALMAQTALMTVATPFTAMPTNGMSRALGACTAA